MSLDDRVRTDDGACPLILKKRIALMLAGLSALAILPYIRAAQLPLISDDYLQIFLGQKYGPISRWPDLIQDPLYRCRSTSLELTYWTWQYFGLNTLAYNWSGIVLHVLNTWLVFALGAWRLIGWRLAGVAAAFFAVHEGHQEAVIWYAALPELLVFFFCMLTLLAWIAWLRSGCARTRYYLAALSAFVLALASKESSVAVVPLLLAVVAVERSQLRRAVTAVLPMAVLAVVYALAIHASRPDHLFYRDGTFSLSAPFLKTLAISTGRLFWFWGLAGLLAMCAFRPAHWKRTLSVAAVWVFITFLPYSFLTYMPRVPSRHTYLASAGLALVVGAGVLAMRERTRSAHRWALPVLLGVLIAHNCVYIWTRKHTQYLERAAPTEILLAAARAARGPIHLHCFPYGLEIAQMALRVTGISQPDALVIGGRPPENAVSICVNAHAGAAKADTQPLPSVSLQPTKAAAGDL